MCRRELDFDVLALAGSRLSCKDAATVDLLEVAIREFVAALGVRGFRVVDPQMPQRVLLEAVSLDEGVFPSRARLMLTPFVSLVQHALAVTDKVLGVIESSPVLCDRHSGSPSPRRYCDETYVVRSRARINDTASYPPSCR